MNTTVRRPCPVCENVHYNRYEANIGKVVGIVHNPPLKVPINVGDLIMWVCNKCNKCEFFKEEYWS